MSIDWSAAVHGAGAGAAAGSSAGPYGAAAGAVVGGLFNVGSQIVTNLFNRDLQRESWDKMSISSRVKELEANGLNKLFAANSMPNYSLSTTMRAPEVDVGAAIDAYAAAKQIQQMDVTTQNLRLQNQILNNEYSSSKSKAIIDRINEAIASRDYDIINNRQENGILSGDPKELQLLGYGEKFVGARGDNYKDILRNFLGLGAEDEELRRLREENAALKSGYKSANDYDQWNYDRPGFDWDSEKNLRMLKIEGTWYYEYPDGTYEPVYKD